VVNLGFAHASNDFLIAALLIYSLAVVAMYMLTGKAIFAEEDVYAGYKKRRNADEVIREALEQIGVPRSMVAMFAKALAFDPKRRPVNVEELSAELAAVLEPATEEVPRLARVSAPGLEPPAPFGYHQTTPTIPHQAVTPPAGAPTVRMPAAAAAAAVAASAAPGAPPPAPDAGAPHGGGPTPPPGPQPVKVWQPPVVRPPWMMVAGAASGPARRLALVDVPQSVSDRTVHFVAATNDVVDLTGSQAQKVRVTFINTQGGVRILHVKGMTCFIAHLGGRPSPAVHLDQPSDLALVTPRAQEIGHIRVATGTAEQGYLVFPLGSERVAISTDDCTDPILFDFGPGSDAYFVYTQGRVLLRMRRR